jgi:S-adenosyl-L-methionine hydrolase (adenosine-forming)
MLVLFTDFGLEGPYTGQMKAVLLGEAPGVPIVDLCADLPPFDAQGAAYLLAAYAAYFPAGAVFVCVVDPGVGSARDALVVEADGRRFVGPDNGLLALVARRAARAAAWRITWTPEHLSSSFHGRDLFAPVAARLARGDDVPVEPLTLDAVDRADWPDELARIIYVDRYGNLVSGHRAAGIDAARTITAGGRAIAHGATFSAVPAGDAFWYANANGLIEIAVNQARADAVLGLGVGDAFTIENGTIGDDTTGGGD